jgi:transposase-like protein
MAQHFTQQKAYRDFSVDEIFNLDEQQAWQKFAEMRWGSTTSMPCPGCGVIDHHYPRRTRKQWRCKHCDIVFSATTGTPFANRKLPFRKILQLIYFFIENPKGTSANRIHAILGITFRSAFTNLGKIREALFETQDKSPPKGVVQIDCGHFCGKPRRPRKRNTPSSAIANHWLKNRKASIVPPNATYKIEPWNLEKLKKRRIVFVLRQLSEQMRQGATRTITAVLRSENKESVIPVIHRCVAKHAVIQSDDGKAFSSLSAWYDHQVVRHSAEYCTDAGVNNNQSESFFSRMRRAEYGTYHGMRPQYLAFYAAEIAWREDSRRMSLRRKFDDLFRRIFECDISKAWRGYIQGRRLGFEYLG